jgi:hypothetical protein
MPVGRTSLANDKSFVKYVNNRQTMDGFKAIDGWCFSAAPRKNTA